MLSLVDSLLNALKLNGKRRNVFAVPTTIELLIFCSISRRSFDELNDP